MSEEIDRDSRPRSYFRPRRLEEHLLSRVKGAKLRRHLQRMLNEGRCAEVLELLGPQGIDDTDRRMLESVHPSYMGGNYLPEQSEGEVEVARVTIASTTWDVTCVYARAEGGRIHFRVVDEYGGETLSGPGAWVADAPLPLGEFTDRFLGAWDLVACCRCNFETDVQAALQFFTVDSWFYPGLDALCRRTVEKVYAEFVDDRCE